MKILSDYCTNNLLVLPQALFSMPEAKVMLQHNNSMIFYKNLERDLIDVEFYTNTPCIIYIKRGQETLTTSDNSTYELTPNTAVFLPQGINLHSDFVKSSGDLTAYLLFFDQDIILEFLTSLKNTATIKTSRKVKPSEPLTIQCNGVIDTYFTSIHNVFDSLSCPSQFIRIKLLEFLHLLMMHDECLYQVLSSAHTSTKNPKRNLVRLLSDVNAYKLTINDLANLSGRSISSFTRDFKAIYNMPPKQWLQSKRLSHAKSLLIDNDISVTQAALDVGFDNVSHFITSFKKKYELTPKQIKQQK